MSCAPFRLPAAILAAAMPAAAGAQALQPWPTIVATGTVSGKVVAYAEVIGRAARSDTRPSQLLLRPLIGYKVTPRLTLWGGYGHIVSYVPGASALIEDRLFQQITGDIGRAGPARLSTRVRLEQRFIHGDSATAWRLRTQLRAAMPLGQVNGPQAVAWAEPFVAFNRTTQVRRTIDQLRLFAGVSLPLARRTDLEIGYLRQRINREPLSVSNDVVPIVVTFRF